MWERAPDPGSEQKGGETRGLSPRRSALSSSRYCAPPAAKMSLGIGSAAWAPGMPPCLVNRLVGEGGTAQMEGIVRAADVSQR